MLKLQLIISTATTEEEFRKDVEQVERRNRSKVVGNISISEMTGMVMGNTHHVRYNTNRVPALDSKMVASHERARGVASAIISQMAMDLGVNVLVLNDRPHWIEYYR